MAFQAAVALWFASHLLARTPVGGRFGLNNAAIPISIQLETGDGLDDIEVKLSDGGSIHIQCKTTANLSDREASPLGKTITQHAVWLERTVTAGGTPDPTKTAGLLAVGSGAPQTLDILEASCRAFDMGGNWASTPVHRNKAEKEALALFESLAKPAWQSSSGAHPNDDQLVQLARHFHVARFDMDEGHRDWREATQLLAHRVFADAAVSEAAMRDLRGLMRDLIRSGAPADRRGLLRELRRRGHRDVTAADYEADVTKLRAVTHQELLRLERHSHLPLVPPLRVERQCDAPLAEAISAGSTLVVGEPGAGKTGALVSAATTILSRGGTAIFLSVDRFPGVAIAADLASELGLQRPLLDVLAAFPGLGPKLLIVDALDAARGGPAEAVFAALIERARADLDEWTVVASIRTFDLRNGRRYREAFHGTPVDPDYADPALSAVMHFVVPRLSEQDLTEVGSLAPQMATLLNAAPGQLRALLTSIFNLSLAAQLLSDGVGASAFSAISTQSGLIDVYEDTRLTSTAMQQAARAACAVMLGRRRLAVRKVLIEHDSIDAAIQTGVLVANDDLVRFAHHVLFDHVTGRFFLDWDDPGQLLLQLSGETASALLLAPALRFAIERLWRNDDAGRPHTWRLLADIFATDQVDPVLGHVALRVASESVESEPDIGDLLSLVAASPAGPGMSGLLNLLSRFVAMDSGARPAVASRDAVWARLSEALLATRERALLEPARVLLLMLFDKPSLATPGAFLSYGRASRALLEAAWFANPELTLLGAQAIRFVGKSFASDARASRLLLDRILREPRFSQHADQEAGWLGEQILPIVRADPEFAVEIYRCLYSQTISDNTSTMLGGVGSRILPLTSNRRQDYDHALWRLGTSLPEFLAIDPASGTRALIEASVGKDSRDSYARQREPERVTIGSEIVEMRGHEFEYRAWDDDDATRFNRDDDLLRNYFLFLRSCSVDAFQASVAAASVGHATAAVWNRIFRVGGERIAELADQLWPLFERIDFLNARGTARAAATFAALAWLSRTNQQKAQFESLLIGRAAFEDPADQHRWQSTLKGFFERVEEDALVHEPSRELRRALAEACAFSAQTASHIATGAAEDHYEWKLESLRREGIDPLAEPQRTVREASDALYERLGQTPGDHPRPYLAALWSEALALVALLDAANKLHEKVDMPAWGHVSNVVERIASCPNYLPDVDGLPSLPVLFSLLQRLSASPYPKPKEEDL
ncbi:hypothetical protein ASE11_24790 [Hydrogenophaga sp. Root209]|uniref:hypothetical protein n=1 Tax=Hydrogenophaga sp. Root209 TaxID=1736490 RepID=UPI0006F384CD|nr:hypothetical protein [Hydrogenophaga sp. Root209]KRC03842.1 hypothetical protein ASE11_24790 [Hydrogenophaga sp. Root209]